MSHHQRLLTLLEKEGPLSSAAVQKHLQISRPTLSRLMRQSDGDILRLGQTRRVRYALPRSLPGLPETIPVHRVDESGRAHPHAQIRPLKPQEWAWEEDAGTLRIGTGLPREVADLWPGGYMGQALGSDDSGDHRLMAMMAAGEDLPGNLLLGETALARFLAMDPQARSLDELPELARAAEAGQHSDGLLGGKWPKFTAWMENHQILVKFARLDEAANRRDADLLVAEATALESLHRLDIAVPPTRIIDRDGYRFLAQARFDRVGRLGRRSVIRLAHLGGKGVDPDDWRASAQALKRSKRISPEAADRILLMENFAALIGNEDRSGENLAFFPEADEKLSLAPAFDMLPTSAALDDAGQAPERLPAPPMPATGELSLWHQAAQAAADYWQRLANEQRVSFEFRKLAAAQGKQIAQRLERISG